MSFRVAVVGATGTAGGEFLRLALNHPHLEIGTLTGHETESFGGAVPSRKLGWSQPHLRPLADREVLAFTLPGPGEPLSSADPVVADLGAHDVVVLALPHGHSGSLAEVLPAEVLVLDLGADHRLSDPQAWAEFYGGPAAEPWTYGLPELIDGRTERALGRAEPATAQRAAIAASRRIAIPGCNVTAVTLGLQPGVAEGVVEPADLVAVLANGYSGAGRVLKPQLLAAEALGSAQPYAVGGGHRHIPEIQQNLAQAGAGYVRPRHQQPAASRDYTISFTPTLVPMSRGILATATARLSQAWQVMLEADNSPNQETSRAWLREVWQDAYAAEAFVEVLPAGQWPNTGMTLGANPALIQVALDRAAGRVVTVSALDNLVKGTAGTAIQCLNLALGLPETLGLAAVGVAP